MASKKLGRRWAEEEVELDLVKNNYTLTGALTNAKTKSMVENKWKDIAVLSTAWLKESHFKPKISRKNGLILKAGKNVMLRYLKKKQIVQEVVPNPTSKLTELQLKFKHYCKHMH